MKIIYEKTNNYVVIDLETTGLKPGYHEIIEVSCIKVKDDEVIDKLCTLVKPKKSIPSFITNLTGITNEMVSDAPNIEDILYDIHQFIEGHTILGQNVNFGSVK